MTMSKKYSGAKLIVVFDTSVLIAAALRSNFSQVIVEQAREGEIQSVSSEEILTEFCRSLKKKSDFSPDKIQKYVDEIRIISKIVKPIQKLSAGIIRDESDNKILECAIAGEANLVISLDQDLIALKEFNGIGIIHPKTFHWMTPKD